MTRTIDYRKHVAGIFVVLGCLMWLSMVSTANTYKVREVDVTGAKALIDAGALVVDVRGKEQFNARHIPGAMLIALDDLRSGIPAQLRAIAKDRPILVYCNQGLVHGPEGTDILNKAGFAGAVNLKDGIEGWVGAGQAVRKI